MTDSKHALPGWLEAELEKAHDPTGTKNNPHSYLSCDACCDMRIGARTVLARASILMEALVWADEMLTARDQMNAKVHCAPVRLSPLTERVKQALAEWRGDA